MTEVLNLHGTVLCFKLGSPIRIDSVTGFSLKLVEARSKILKQ